MTAYLAPQFDTQFFDGSTVAAGYKLYTYESGTTTPKAVYSDQAGTVPHTNPIVLDANGRVAGQMFLGSGEYTFTLKTSGDVLVKTWNDVAGASTTVDDALIRSDLASTSDASKGAGMVGFIQPGSGAVARTLNDKVKERVSVKDFGVVGDGSDEYTKIQTAWAYALSAGVDLYFPAGEYSSGVNNMPFKNTDYPATTLLDCGNIMIYGDGPATILRSDSVAGADVLNLYSLKNLHIRNLAVKAAISGSAAGSNGCSIVGGFDNVTVDGLWCYDLPYVDHGTYLDGGKAFTIQTGTPATECGTVKATRIYAKGCVFGADVSVDLVNWATKKHAVDIDIVAEDCFVAAVFSAGAATGPISEGMTTGIRITGQAVNCQQDVQIGRAHGIYVDMQVITNKSAAARRLNPSGGAWNSADAIVTTMTCTYAKNSILRITGDKGGCDYGVQIGGTTAGSSGQNGATEFCDIYLDFGNQASVADFNLIDSGGDSIHNCNLQITQAMAATLPVGLYASANGNTVLWGSQMRLNAPVINGALNFAYTDGITSYNSLERDSYGMYFKQVGGSSADFIVNGTKDHLGNVKYGIRNDGYVATAGRGVASAVATIKGVLPIYTEANVLWGYVPVYTTYTP